MSQYVFFSNVSINPTYPVWGRWGNLCPRVAGPHSFSLWVTSAGGGAKGPSLQVTQAPHEENNLPANEAPPLGWAAESDLFPIKGAGSDGG